MSLYAKSSSSYLTLGLSSATIIDSGNGFNIGYGFNKVSESGFYLGILFDYESVTINSSSLNGFSGDLQLGVAPFKGISIFAIGSALTQSIDTNGYGFGYGIGGNIKLKDKVSLSIQHKLYDMTNKYEEYDYKTTQFNLVYNF